MFDIWAGTPPASLFIGIFAIVLFRCLLRSRGSSITSRWLLRLLRRLSDDECSFPVTVREQAFISALAVAFLVLVTGWIVDEWTVVVRFLALAFVVERTNPIGIGGRPRLAGRWIRRLVLIALLCSLTLLVGCWLRRWRSIASLVFWMLIWTCVRVATGAVLFPVIAGGLVFTTGHLFESCMVTHMLVSDLHGRLLFMRAFDELRDHHLELVEGSFFWWKNHIP